MSRPADSEVEGRSWAHAIRDHLEAIVIALALALVLKHFCVEAFEIPSGSMHPTLVGEEQTVNRVGDRIVVDKIAYWLSGPSRWDIPVFRFPLDASRVFVKRAVGLPNEQLRIGPFDGDIWVRKVPEDAAAAWISDDVSGYEIAAKPRKVRLSVYRPVYPPIRGNERLKDLEFEEEHDPKEPARRWFMTAEGPSEAWQLPATDRFTYTGGERSALHARHAILTSSRPDTWRSTSWQDGAFVRDIRLRARIVVGEEAAARRELTFGWLPEGVTEHRVVLRGPEAQSTCSIYREGKEIARAPVDATLHAGQAFDVEWESIDGRFHVWIDGDEVARLTEPRVFGDRRGNVSQRLRIEAEGGPLEVLSTAIDRDIHYRNEWSPLAPAADEGIVIPDDCYLLIGDNQRDVPVAMKGSYDSRKWEVVHIRLKDGTLIEHDNQAEIDYAYEEGTDAQWQSVTDIHGVERRWRDEDEDPDVPQHSTWEPFVKRDQFVGRAFFVFWPCLPDFPGRVRPVR